MTRNPNKKEKLTAGKMRPCLRIYIASDCFSCEEAILVTPKIAQQFSSLLIEIVNLDDPEAIKPENVFAVPTYVLDGRIISLGNLHCDQLFAKISNALSNNFS